CSTFITSLNNRLFLTEIASFPNVAPNSPTNLLGTRLNVTTNSNGSSTKRNLTVFLAPPSLTRRGLPTPTKPLPLTLIPLFLLLSILPLMTLNLLLVISSPSMTRTSMPCSIPLLPLILKEKPTLPLRHP
ncbi:hypothetical protein H0H93_004232, partial [Arthromyces matolae]